MVDARNFLLNTDYPMDKVIYLKTGSFTVASNTYDDEPGIIIPHTVGIAFLPIMIWSESPTFDVCHQLYDEASMMSYWSVNQYGQRYEVGTTSTDVYINRINLYNTSKTIYYRILGFQPTGHEDIIITNTVPQSDLFTLNTEYNYMKLYDSGIMTADNPSVSHNLGYVPRVMIWDEDTSGSIYTNITSIVGGNYPYGVRVNSNSIYILNPSGSEKIHYRIYIDE